jgi:hypothetical protein
MACRCGPRRKAPLGGAGRVGRVRGGWSRCARGSVGIAAGVGADLWAAIVASIADDGLGAAAAVGGGLCPIGAPIGASAGFLNVAGSVAVSVTGAFCVTGALRGSRNRGFMLVCGADVAAGVPAGPMSVAEAGTAVVEAVGWAGSGLLTVINVGNSSAAATDGAGGRLVGTLVGRTAGADGGEGRRTGGDLLFEASSSSSDVDRMS